MTEARRRRGQAGEDAAEAALVAAGYRVCDRNWRCPLGEVDLVARDGDVVCFVEVKALAPASAYGHPAEKVGPGKQRTLARVALAYLKRYGLTEAVARFDVVAVWLGPDDTVARTEILRDAFTVD